MNNEETRGHEDNTRDNKTTTEIMDKIRDKKKRQIRQDKTRQDKREKDKKQNNGQQVKRQLQQE